MNDCLRSESSKYLRSEVKCKPEFWTGVNLRVFAVHIDNIKIPVNVMNCGKPRWWSNMGDFSQEV